LARGRLRRHEEFTVDTTVWKLGDVIQFCELCLSEMLRRHACRTTRVHDLLAYLYRTYPSETIPSCEMDAEMSSEDLAVLGNPEPRTSAHYRTSARGGGEDIA
jgi:hypothetical protein